MDRCYQRICKPKTNSPVTVFFFIRVTCFLLSLVVLPTFSSFFPSLLSLPFMFASLFTCSLSFYTMSLLLITLTSCSPLSVQAFYSYPLSLSLLQGVFLFSTPRNSFPAWRLFGFVAPFLSSYPLLPTCSSLTLPFVSL